MKIITKTLPLREAMNAHDKEFLEEMKTWDDAKKEAYDKDLIEMLSGMLRFRSEWVPPNLPKETMAEDRQNIVTAAFEERCAHLMALRELEEERKDDDGFSSGTKCCPLCGKGRK